MRLPSREYLDRIMQPLYEQHMNTVEFLPYQPATKNLYGEVLGKTYGTPIAVNLYIEMEPTDLRLQELGWRKEETDILIRAPFILLQDYDLANEDGTVNFSTDDRVKLPHLNRIYQLANFQFREPFRENKPTFVWIGGKRYTNG